MFVLLFIKRTGLIRGQGWFRLGWRIYGWLDSSTWTPKPRLQGMEGGQLECYEFDPCGQLSYYRDTRLLCILVRLSSALTSSAWLLLTYALREVMTVNSCHESRSLSILWLLEWFVVFTASCPALWQEGRKRVGIGLIGLAKCQNPVTYILL